MPGESGTEEAVLYYSVGGSLGEPFGIIELSRSPMSIMDAVCDGTATTAFELWSTLASSSGLTEVPEGSCSVEPFPHCTESIARRR